MLVHLCQIDIAENIQNAWLKTIEDGIHTGDIYNPKTSIEKVGTKGFANALIARLGKKPSKFAAVEYNKHCTIDTFKFDHANVKQPRRELVGIDVYIYADPNSDFEALAKQAQALAGEFQLEAIANRGTKIWPQGMPETFCTDQWRLRYKGAHSHENIAKLLLRFADKKIEVVRTEYLYDFDGEPKY
jgi:isocitrate dehydrogenase